MIRRRTISPDANKAIKDMIHEEALAALPKLREEAARADARVHEAMKRVAKPTKRPPTSSSTGITRW